MGCPDESFSIRSIIQTRNEYDLESWVIFLISSKVSTLYIIKLFLIFFKEYGIPDYLIKVIEKVYNNFKIEIKVEIKKT